MKKSEKKGIKRKEIERKEIKRKQIGRRVMAFFLSLLLSVYMQPLSLPQVYAVDEIENINITLLNAEYQKGQARELVTAISGNQEGDKIFYSSNGVDWQEEMLAEEAAGEYPVYVKISREGCADYLSGKLTAVITKADAVIEVTPYEGTYDGAEHPVVSVAGLEEGDVVTCSYAGERTCFTYSDENSIQLPCIKNAGEYGITVTVERDTANYHVFRQQVTAKISAAAVEGITVTYHSNLTYTGSAQDLVGGIEGTQEGDEIFFSLDEGAAWSKWGTDQKPQGTDAQVYTILLKVQRADKEIELNPLSVVIAKADLSIAFAANPADEVIALGSGKECDFSAEVEDTSGNKIESANVIYEVEYDYAEGAAEGCAIGETAEFSGETPGMLIVRRAGHIKVTARVEESPNYNEASVSYQLTILNDAGNLVYFPEETVGYVIGDGSINSGQDGTASGGNTDAAGEVISEQGAVKTYEDDNGAVRYSIALSDADSTQAPEGGSDIDSPPDTGMMSVAGISIDVNSGKVMISDQSEVLEAICNAGAGGRKLEIHVTAKKAEGTKKRSDGADKAVYSECEAGYTIVISADFYTIMDSEGNKLEGPSGENGWYNTKVAIVPLKGYQIAAESVSGSFGDRVVFEEDSSENGQTPGSMSREIYLKDQKDKVIGPVKVEMKIDYSKPEAPGITISPKEENGSAGQAEEVLPSETGNHHYYKDQVKVTFEAKDAVSGVQRFVWKYVPAGAGSGDSQEQNNGELNSNEDTSELQGFLEKVEEDAQEPGRYTAELLLPESTGEALAQLKGSLEMYAVDKAGNRSDTVTERGIIIDNIPPQVEAGYADGNYYDEQNHIRYYGEAAVVTFRITEANFLTEGVAVELKKDGQTLEDITSKLSWEQSAEQGEDIYTAGYTIEASADGSNDGRYSFTVNCRDLSGNETEQFQSDEIVIDTRKPEMTVEYTDPSNPDSPFEDEEGIKYYYYNKAITASFTIEEDYFCAEDVKVRLAKDGGEAVLLGETDLEWTPKAGMQNTYEASYTIEAEEDHKNDGEYVFTVSYFDKSGNEAEVNAGQTEDDASGQEDGSAEKISYSSGVVVLDTVQPEIGFHYDDYSAENSQTAVITITERNFDKENIVVGIDAKTISGAPVTPNDLEAYLKKECEWTSEEGDIHKAVISKEFADAIYQLTLNYTDLAMNCADEVVTGKFTVDWTAPRVTVEYSEPFKRGEDASLGFYNPKLDSYVTVTFTAFDEISGVSRINWWYRQSEGAGEVKEADEGHMDIKNAEIKQDSADPAKFTASVTLPRDQAEQLKGNFSYEAVDACGNSSKPILDKNNIIVVDSIAPKVAGEYYYTAELEKERNPEEEKVYFHEDVTVAFRLKEANFYEEAVIIKVSKDGGPWEKVEQIAWKEDADELNTYVGECRLEAPNDHTGDGEYVFTVEYTDTSGNEMEIYTSGIIVVDTIAPVIAFHYNDYSAEEPQTAVIMIHEHNFCKEDIRLEIAYARTITEEPVAANDLEAYLKKACEWTSEEGDIHKAVIISEEFVDAIYQLTLNYTDLAGNTAEKVISEPFVTDHTPPSVSAEWVEYSPSLADVILSAISFGYYNPAVTVTFTAYDETAGIAWFAWKYEREAGASTTNKESDENFNILSDITQDEVDKTKFTASVTLSGKEAGQLRGNFSYKAVDKCGNESGEDPVQDKGHVIVVDTVSPKMTVEYSEANRGFEGKAYYNSALTAAFTVTEANFYAEDIIIELARDNGTSIRIQPEWKEISQDVYVGTHTIEALDDHSNDGDYVFTVSYTDRSKNEMSSYTSGVMVMDTMAPVIAFHYDDYANEAHPQTAVITITEHNFYREEVVVRAEAETIGGQEVNINDLQAYLRTCEWTQEGDVYTAAISDRFMDGIYAMVFDYTDLALNQAEETATDRFVVDHTAPSAADMSIAYSSPLKETVLAAVTFGYYNPDVEITFAAHDTTSGIDYFTWSYARQDNASTINVDGYADARLAAVQDAEDKTKFTAKATIPGGQLQQLRGSIAFTATDRFANTSDKVTDDGHVIVVDTISPVMTVEYTVPDHATESKLYYKKPITAVFTVTEANFYSEDVEIELARDGREASRIMPVWTEGPSDTHIGTYTIEAPENHANDGDYVFTVRYTDRSSNRMDTYTSGVMVVDTTIPVILVEYPEENLVNTLPDAEGNDRKYYAAAQTATITVAEHNFNPDDMEYLIEARDVAGSSLDAASLYELSAWSKDGDNNIAAITYTGDANYTINFRYTDLATHTAEEIETQYLTVDVTKPEELTVSYSESVLETVLANISFGFYQAKATVTLTARDSVSGINRFRYEYLNAEGVSNVNAQLADEVIEMSEISFSDDGMTGTASFEIPKQALEAASQFNGTIHFNAMDRAANESDDFQDDKRIVVDSIAPEAEVQYNAPVQTVGNVAYYDGEIAVTVMVREANFYSEDVAVSVVKDGAEYAVTPVWADNSTDEHTGTFTLQEDGDYFVRVDYTDKSNNVMQQYTSEQMTIDTVIAGAVITINGAEADGEDAEGRKVFRRGFKDDVVLGVSFDDTNYESYEIRLKRIRTSISDRNANTVTKIEEDVTEQFIAGHVATGATGGQGTFDTFEKAAENDGIYTMTVALTDKAGHRAETSVFFTVNRYGSVYDYSEYLESLIENGGAYVQEVTEDLVITEYNADTLVSRSLDIEISRDGRPLEDSVYHVTPEINDTAATGSSGWYQYQYTIARENFSSDGVYKVSISSKDATGNTPENTNYEDKAILFRVDSTPPEIVSVTGLEESIIDATTAEVRYTIYDTIGLEEVTAYVNGREREHITDFSADENNCSGSITLLESTDAQRVRLVARDRAGNVTDTDSENFSSAYAFHPEVTVSTNALVRWFADKQLFWGSVGGAGSVLALGTGGAVLLKRRRKAKTA